MNEGRLENIIEGNNLGIEHMVIYNTGIMEYADYQCYPTGGECGRTTCMELGCSPYDPCPSHCDPSHYGGECCGTG